MAIASSRVGTVMTVDTHVALWGGQDQLTPDDMKCRVMVHPDHPEPRVVLTAVKHAASRMRRWPAAMLNRQL